MTTAIQHPGWCDRTRCMAAGDGPHESEPTQVRLRGRGDPSRLLMLLWAPSNGRPTRLRMVVISDMLVNSVDLDLDSAHLAASTIMGLLERARPPEHLGPVPSQSPPPQREPD